MWFLRCVAILALLAPSVHAQLRPRFVQVRLIPHPHDRVGPRLVPVLRDLIDASANLRTSELETRANYVVEFVPVPALCGPPTHTTYSVAMMRGNRTLLAHAAVNVNGQEVEKTAQWLLTMIQDTIRATKATPTL